LVDFGEIAVIDAVIAGLCVGHGEVIVWECHWFSFSV
jgi:hypothetical protein